MDTIQVYQGIGNTVTVQVTRTDGTPAIGVYTGDEGITGVLWPGGAFQAVTSYLTPVWSATGGGPAGLIDVPFSPSSTTDVWPGQYVCLVSLADDSAVLASFDVTILARPFATPKLPAWDGTTFTRAIADYRLFQRVTLQFSQIRLPLDTASPISQFSDPLSRALAFMKIVLVNPSEPTDPDFAKVNAAGWTELLDISEAEILDDVITGHIFGSGITDERWSDYSYRKDPLALQYIAKLGADKMTYVRNLYGYGVGRLTYGSINLGFQANRKQHCVATATSDGEIG